MAGRTPLVEEVARVKMSTLVRYPTNPRIGNIDAIAESLAENGQFKPLIVQKSTSYVLMGNHTFQAAEKLGWKTILVMYVDVDDEKAKAFVLADNRTSDMGTYNPEILAELLRGMDEPTVGTGYDFDDVSSILAAVDEKDAELVTRVLHETSAPIDFGDTLTRGEPIDFGTRVDGANQRAAELLGDDYIPTQIEKEAAEGRIHEDAKIAELEQMVKDTIKKQYELTNYWGIPNLRTDMLVDEIPANLDTWAGDDVTQDDGTGAQHWHYVWGNGTTRGLPWDRTLLSFYTHDDKWEPWFFNPHVYIARVLAKGLKMAVAPDCSMWVDDARFFHLKSQFEMQWMARNMQECGIKIIPNISFTDLESLKYGVIGMPQEPPVAMLTYQFDLESSRLMDQATGLRLWVEEVKPQSLIVYGAPKKTREFVEAAKLPKQLHLVHIENYVGKRRGVAFDKKEGLLSAEGKEVAKKKSAPRKLGKDKSATPKEDQGTVDPEGEFVLPDL